MGWARWPQVVPGQPSRPPLGGINLGIGAFSEHPDLAFEAATCIRSAEHQIVAATEGGLPPTIAVSTTTRGCGRSTPSPTSSGPRSKTPPPGR